MLYVNPCIFASSYSTTTCFVFNYSFSLLFIYRARKQAACLLLCFCHHHHCHRRRRFCRHFNVLIREMLPFYHIFLFFTCLRRNQFKAFMLIEFTLFSLPIPPFPPSIFPFFCLCASKKFRKFINLFGCYHSQIPTNYTEKKKTLYSLTWQLECLNRRCRAVQPM